MGTLSDVFNWVFPRLCLHCKSVIPEPTLLCARCNTYLVECEIPDCELPGQTALGRPVWGRWYYRTGSPIRTCHRKLKYEGRHDVGSFLGELAAVSLQKHVKSGVIDGIVPIPSHRVKLLERGLLPTFVLAKAFANHLGVPVYRNTLIRQSLGPSQSGLTREKRIVNLKNAFALNGDLRGKRILLLDDVLTTGATLDAAAETIEKEGGATMLVAIAFRRETFGSPQH